MTLSFSEVSFRRRSRASARVPLFWLYLRDFDKPNHHRSCLVMSCHIMSHHVTPCPAVSRHVTSCHTMSHHVTSCHIMSHHVVSRHVLPCRVTSCPAMSCPVMSHHVVSHHVLPCRVTSCRVTPCRVTSWRRNERDEKSSPPSSFFATQSHERLCTDVHAYVCTALRTSSNLTEEDNTKLSSEVVVRVLSNSLLLPRAVTWPPDGMVRFCLATA